MFLGSNVLFSCACLTSVNQASVSITRRYAKNRTAEQFFKAYSNFMNVFHHDETDQTRRYFEIVGADFIDFPSAKD